uniref:PIR2-like helical domain-containing protein n=1 Tax=Oryza glumipatula TaxID=40148 RepID=A0A0E0B9J0_9ORYZ
MAEQPIIAQKPTLCLLHPLLSPCRLSRFTHHHSHERCITLPRPSLSSRRIDHIGGRGRRWRALAASRRWADGSGQQPAALPLPQPRRASGRRQQPEEPDSPNPALQLSASPWTRSRRDGGFCFGPLDPVSNIITNAIRHLSTGEDSGADVDEIEMRRGLKTMARGSLKALVGFITSYFRYLPTLEALNFLRAAEGDLLAAVHLVKVERCTSCAFDIGSCTARTALRCAAGAAGHCDPGRVASDMLSLFSKAHKIASHLLSRTADRLTCSAVEHLRHLLLEETNDQICTQRQILVLVPPRLPPELAAFSPLASLGVTVKDERTLERCTKSLQSVLLDKIHGFYLEALALLPQHLLRGRYHRSVVMAGHCYGPLDPVSNIILNTIWYDAAFPVPKEQHLDLDMIGRWALIRAERCSIAGLVAGLSAFAGDNDYNLSELQAIRCLLYANGDFATAMSVLQQALLNQERTMLSDSELCRFMDVMANKRLELYSVMAIAAQHPSADGLLDFLVSERARAMLPRESRRFSREDVRSVIESLLQEPPPSLGMPSELFPGATKRFWADMSSFHSKAKAALENYVQPPGRTVPRLGIVLSQFLSMRTMWLHVRLGLMAYEVKS